MDFEKFLLKRFKKLPWNHCLGIKFHTIFYLTFDSKICILNWI